MHDIRSRRGRWLSLSARGALFLGAALVLGCSGGDDSGGGSALADRWLRLGEDYRASVAVYDGEVPPVLVDLLNPSADEDTPEDDLIALPVHPSGDLLGSYMLRRPDGSHLVWLFFDVPTSEVPDIADSVAGQLDESPWQVIGRLGSSSYAVIEFQNTRADDVTGTTVIEHSPPGGAYSLTVERDGKEQILTVTRAASAPLIEADLDDDLTVDRVHPGLAKVAGLREDDRILRVEETDVSDITDLSRALSELDDEVGMVALTYVLTFAPPATLTAQPYLPKAGLSLPGDFPLRDLLNTMIVDQYQSYVDPSGDIWAASILTEDSTSVTTARFRDALAADEWEILSDQPVGFATVITFANVDGELLGTLQVDLFPEDESFTQVVLQIQSGGTGGN